MRHVILWAVLMGAMPLCAQQAPESGSRPPSPAEPTQVDALALDDESVAPDDDASRVASDGHVYYVARLADLTFVPSTGDAGEVPLGKALDVATSDQARPSPEAVLAPWRTSDRVLAQRVVIDGEGEVVVAPERWNGAIPVAARLALRLAAPRTVSGRVFIPNADWTGQIAVDFVVPADAFSPDARAAWLEVAADAAAAHLDAQNTGVAWYRHVRDAALHALGEADDVRERGAGRRFEAGFGSVQREFELFSGGRALSENLALDRLLPVADDVEGFVPIDEIEGVSVRAYDWGPLVEGLDPARDPLAAFVPADQHGLFFPSFPALLAVADELDGLAAPLGHHLEMRAESADTRARYEHQLGLPLSDLARLLGPQLIRSVALTGGDASLRTGSDVALLFEPKEPISTFAAITARVNLALAGEPGVERVSGEIGGRAYSGLRNADRSICSYVADLDGAVVVTNSLAQLARVVTTAAGETPSLDETPEYAFFRERYRLGDEDESALLVLSDATIRRWCGPRLRIGEARRSRAAAVLGEVTARCLEDATLSSGREHVDLPQPDDLPFVGVLRLDGTRVRSQVFGTLAFATPVSELDLDLVSEEEDALYTRWRQQYETNWRRVFDPIAVRVGVGGGRLALDVTVRPLIANSDYERYLELARDGSVKPRSGDLHPGTLLQYTLAVDSKALSGMPETGMVKMLFPNVDIFGWIGGSASLYVDDGLFWDELLAADDSDDFMDEHLGEVPVGLQVEVANGLKLAAFLTAMRGVVESSAPGMVTWENREYAGQTYVRVSERESFSGLDLALYYTTGPRNVTFSLSEELIQRAIDRRLARASAETSGDALPDAGEAPWIGEHLGMRVDVPSAVAKIQDLVGELQRGMRTASWSNLPILDEWQRRFPDEDPVDVHERWFARRPTCPGGGGYRWNPAWRAMESTLYGHPGAPRTGPDLPTVSSRFGRLRLGVTFEDDGLRARAEVELRDDEGK